MNKPPTPNHQDIATAAYYLSEKRGGGDPSQNWLDAEQALLQTNKKAATQPGKKETTSEPAK